MATPLIKHMWNELSFEQNLRVLDSPEVGHIVFLYRAELFEAALSNVIARMMRNWTSSYDDPALRLDTPIDEGAIQNQMRWMGRGQSTYRKWLETSRRPHMIISYETVFGDRTDRRAVLGAVCAFLGFRMSDPSAVSLLDPHERYQTWRLFESAPNYAAVLERFRGQAHPPQ